MKRIGVIGLGRMGSAIALRLVAQGHSVTGWTRSGRRIDSIAAADTLASLVQQSDTLILSLLNDDAVAETLDAMAAHDLTGKIIIETSTVVPTILKDRIAALGCMAVDAPISGGPELVAAGTCGVFIGGTDDAAIRAKAVIARFSNRVFHVGPLGTGLVMKTINNSMLQAYFAGLEDMMPVAKRAGLPLETALRILSGGPAGVPMVADRIPKILGTDESAGFTVNAVLKDCGVFQRVAQAYGVDTPTLKLFAQMAQAGVDQGLGEKDPAALIAQAYERD